MLPSYFYFYKVYGYILIIFVVKITAVNTVLRRHPLGGVHQEKIQLVNSTEIFC